MQSKHVFNWRPDVGDQRDFIFREHFKVSPKSLPKAVDLRPWMSAVEDQGSLGSCTANAFAGNLEYIWARFKKDLFQASRLFIYFNERVLLNTVNEDSGAILRDGIKSLVQHGVCSETTVPYVEGDFTVKPSDAAYAEGLPRRISKYLRVTDLASVKQSLADGFPVVFGIPVYESFESDKVARTGTVPTPKKTEQMLGGHAMLVVGYDDKTKRVRVRNSWGSSWGSKGYCTLPYDYFAQADDMWTVRA